ncbi:hypothetical protein I7I51_04475 [Histoplasma capsulatum]|uniref:Ubiquitin carboxyl-terminal hydrolase n=1 Tax=Ajellomyces capsulatus TaxID=5037 RepID=A0A8A1M723_AJECA|nr:hypothetical protein I7I51_04475 [Histoplasma capsulatum]
MPYFSLRAFLPAKDPVCRRNHRKIGTFLYEFEYNEGPFTGRICIGNRRALDSDCSGIHNDLPTAAEETHTPHGAASLTGSALSRENGPSPFGSLPSSKPRFVHFPFSFLLDVGPAKRSMNYKKHYIPLESDPEIFTELMHDLGVSSSLKFVDVCSLEEEELCLVQRPVLALILILPSCPAYEHRTIEGQIIANRAEEEVVWLKQTINNACGLYAILHAVCNLPSSIST